MWKVPPFPSEDVWGKLCLEIFNTLTGILTAMFPTRRDHLKGISILTVLDNLTSLSLMFRFPLAWVVTVTRILPERGAVSWAGFAPSRDPFGSRLRSIFPCERVFIHGEYPCRFFGAKNRRLFVRDHGRDAGRLLWNGLNGLCRRCLFHKATRSE